MVNLLKGATLVLEMTRTKVDDSRIGSFPGITESMTLNRSDVCMLGIVTTWDVVIGRHM